MTRSVAGLVMFCAFSACAGSTATPPPSPSVTPAVMPAAVAWTRQSAEHRALFLQTYRLAGDRLSALARDHARGTWAVILDADETVLDASLFEERRAITGALYREDDWEAYVREENAAALPGAVEFVRHVRALGGRVAIVTNRGGAICDATRRNLRQLQLDADVVLCRPPDSDDKNPRFRAIQEGTAAAGLPPLRVLMWIGDNIRDFPGLTQDSRSQPDSVFVRFGRDYFVLPNPMYGSWRENQ